MGGFCPNENSIFSYVYDYSKHSYRSNFVFWKILSRHQFYLLFLWSVQLTLSTEQIMFWEDFVPRKILSRIGFSPLIYHSIILNIHQGQIMYFSGFFVMGDFVPTIILLSPKYIITVEIHIDHICILEDFVPGRFCPDNNFTFFYHGLIQILCPGRFCPREDFIPDRIQFFALSLNSFIKINFLHFSGFFVMGGILSQQELYLLCISSK